MLNTFQDDDCCNTPLITALGMLQLVDVGVWMCPVCGCEWRARIIGSIKHWAPVPMIEVLRV